MSELKEYDRVMSEQGSGTGIKYRNLNFQQKMEYRWAVPPPPDKRFLQPTSLKVKCGIYEFNVHDEVLWTESKVIQEMVKLDDKNAVDLTSYQPEMIARMIQFCYFEKYAISPDAEVAPRSKTVSQVMAENIVGEASPSIVPTEPKYDAALHMNMYVLGLKLEMKYLVAYAQKRCRKALAMEGESFWACVEMLNNLEEDEEVIDKVERRLKHNIEGRVWSTRRPFKELEKLRPSLAAQISDLAKRRFGQP